MNQIEEAVQILKSDGVVGMPTETVYGLAASIESPVGIELIFKTKERPFFDPLIVHVSSLEQAKRYAKNWNSLCDLLTQTFWPGPLTIVVPKNDDLNPMITSGLDSVGLRMPEHPQALEIISKLGQPVAAPSANKFKKTSPTKKEHVQLEFPGLHVVEGGPCRIGIESTVVGVFNHEIKIYRPGMITKKQIENALKLNDFEVPVSMSESPVAPGQLKHHYMPKLPVILMYDLYDIKLADTSHIPQEVMQNPNVLTLNSEPYMCARELYDKLRECDQDASCILIPLESAWSELDEWAGILNRLEKAASFLTKKKS